MLEEAWSEVTAKGYWSRPKVNRSQAGSPNPDLLYHAVGLCLSDWERAEEALGGLFGVLLGQDGALFAKARAIFGSSNGSSSRREMVSALGVLYCQGFQEVIPDLGKGFTALTNAHDQASHRRNDIAHGIIAGPVSVDKKPARGAFLVAPSYLAGKNDFYGQMDPDDVLGALSQSQYRFNHGDLLLFAHKFRQLRLAVLYLELCVNLGDGRDQAAR